MRPGGAAARLRSPGRWRRWRARGSATASTPRGPPLAAHATAGAVVALAWRSAAWAAFQPVRAVHAGDAAIDRLEAGALDASADIARIGSERNPLAVEPLWELGASRTRAAAATRPSRPSSEAVRLQPANAETWRRLGEYRLNVLDKPRGGAERLQGRALPRPVAPESQADALAAARAVREQQTSAAPVP